MSTPIVSIMRSEGIALLRWWLQELRDIGQGLLGRVAPRLLKHVVIEFKNNAAEVYVLRRSSPSDRITISRDPSGAWPERLPAQETLGEHRGARTTLVLAHDDTFSFDLLVPHALRRDLDKVIALHLESALPFAPDQFAVDYQIREHLPSSGKIRVKVLVAHRRRLDQLRDLAHQWELRPTRISAPGEAGAISGDFIRSSIRFRSIRLSLLERRLSVLVLALALMNGALIVGQWTYERIVIDTELQRVNVQAQIASHLADRLRRESAPVRDLVRIARAPDASDVLADLTRTIPSYAWVYKLHVEASSTGPVAISMGAFAPQATMLVSLLANTHRFGTVQLISATSAGGPGGLDRLALTASLPPARDEARGTSAAQ